VTASILTAKRALCASCAGSETRQQAPSAEASGIIGLAAPFGEVALVRAGLWEVIDRAAFSDADVPLKLGHGGPVIGSAHVFGLRHGLFFEARDVAKPSDVLSLARGCSIEFTPLAVSTERYQGGTLRHVECGRINAIAIIRTPQQPAYRST
jgi:hypothetical protein